MKALKKIKTQLHQYLRVLPGRRPFFPALFKKMASFIIGEKQASNRQIATRRNYFFHVFNSVSDMVFILDKKGTIISANHSALYQLSYEDKSLKGKNIERLVRTNEPFFPKLKELKNTGQPVSIEIDFYNVSGEAVPVLLTVTSLTDLFERKAGIVLTAKDLRSQMQSEEIIAQAIIEAREKERLRLAQDLHDSLGQSLSATKFFMSATIGQAVTSEQRIEVLMRSSEALAEVMAEMRDICFNLMPVAIGELSLVQAVKEACSKFRRLPGPEFEVREISTVPPLCRKMKTDLYRIVQEFITNALKYSQASKIHIVFYGKAQVLSMILRDNGKGFDMENTRKGMGLRNVELRVKSHNGILRVRSMAGKGTAYFINVPIKSNHES